MVSLLDVNVLIALFDPRHVHYESAHAWWSENRDNGWATCPLTENGFVRILSNPAYPGKRTTTEDAARRLAALREADDHVYWPATPSICDQGRVDFSHLAGHRQVTDAYLLALAVERGGRLATFDRSIGIRSAPGAKARNLELIEGR